MNKNTGVKIQSINGAEVLKLQNGGDAEIKWNCVFAKSMILDKLEKLGLNISKQHTTRDIINVKFDYAYKEKDADDEDKIKKEEIRKQLYEEGFELDVYKTVKKERVFDKKIKYRFWFRTAGKAKNGADYFINEELLNKIKEWQSMGIKLGDKDVDLVSFEVYKSLVSSAITGYETIKPNEILIVKDLDSYSELQDIITVYRDDKTGYSKAKHEQGRCKNTLWDGMGLLQGGTGFKSLRHHFFKICGFCCDFQQYFKDYYKDEYETITVKDMFGRDVKISEVKLITTNNAIKWTKFIGETEEAFNRWAEYIEENGCQFGICKTDHKSKYGSKQRMSYQMVNSLPLSEEEVEKVFTDSNDYINDLKNDVEGFKKHLEHTKSTINTNEMLLDILEKNSKFENSYLFKDARKKYVNKFKNNLKNGKVLAEGDNETILANPMLLLEYVTGQLDKYIVDGVISGYIDKTLPKKNSCYCKRFKKGAKIGGFRSPQNSMNNVLLLENKYDNILNKYFGNFGENVIAVNMLYNDIQDRASGLDEDGDFIFATDNETIVSACEKCQDYPTMVNKFKKSTKRYNNTMEDLAKIDNCLQASQKAIGTSSNVAMLYLTQYWNMVNNNYDDEVEKQKMLDNVCILAVLAQVAVDSSKRMFEVGNGDNGLNNEIERLRKELPREEKPLFWQYTSSAFTSDSIAKKIKNRKDNKEVWKDLTKDKKNKLIATEKEEMINKLNDYKCPMNMLLQLVDGIKKAEYTDRIYDDEFIFLYGTNDTRNKKQAKKIEEMVDDFTKAKKSLFTDETLDDEDKDTYIGKLYSELIEGVKKYKIKLDTMSLLVSRALSVDSKLKSNSKNKSALLNALYQAHKDIFLQVFKSEDEM